MFLGAAPLGKIPLGALPFSLFSEFRYRESPFYTTTSQDTNLGIYQSTTISSGSLYDSTSTTSLPIYQETD
jgi:hypothetical protein